MSKRPFLLPIIILLSLALPSAVFGQCMAEAGTITVNDDGGGTNPFVVCFGEAIDVTSDNNFTVPPSGPAPAMVYLFYSCAPTGPDPAADPCWTNWFWTGSNMQTTNDGGIVGAIGINTFIIVPIVIDNNQAPPNGPGIDVDGDMCWDINEMDTETFTFLNELVITELNVDDCAGEVTIEITGGYPELFPGSYMVTNTGAGTLSQSGPDGGMITISGLMDGDNYSFTLDDDGNGCSASFSGGPIDQMITPPVLSYPSICEGSSAFPDIASPAGGTFDFVTPPGDGASIDPFTGELSDVIDSHEIIYTESSGCAPVSTTFTIDVTPPPPPPVVDGLYEFCPEGNTVVTPGGSGDFFSLYDDEFGIPIETGSSFDFLDYLNPGDPETEFFVSQTIDDCESELVAFSVIIYGDSPPLIDPIFVVCEGEDVTLEPISGNDNNNSDFYFYSNSALTDLLHVGEIYTFTVTMSTTIYITELNEVCETIAEPVDILMETPPTAVIAEPMCYAGNTFYSILVTTDAADIIASTGLVTNNNDGTFTISDIASGDFVDLTLENAAGDCTTDIELPEFDCGCVSPNPPVSNGNITICSDDPIPALTVNVAAGQTVDWYNAASGGTLLLAGNPSYTPPAAGTYYAETRVIADGCVSSTRTAVTLTIDPVPTLASSMVTCAPDLLSYTAELQITNAATITVNAGSVTNNGGGSFTVSNIPVGTDLVFTAFHTNMNCTLGPETVTSPACPCPTIDPPVTMTNLTICPGDPIPTLTVTVDAGQTADWYDQPAGGNLLAGSTLSYTPPSTGTYYVEARDPVNNCLSSRIAITISTSPAPSYMVQSTSCAPDLLSYQVQLTISNADQLMANAGTVTDNGGGSFTVSGIPAGMDLQITVSNSMTTCSLVDNITAPDCNCAIVAAPTSNGDVSICTGDPIPSLSVSVNAGETVDWYDLPVGGSLLVANSTSFTPVMAGTYYAETRVLADGCVSATRTGVTLTINPTPSFNSFDTICAPDLLSYTVTLSLNDAGSITVNEGDVTDDGGGNFTISNISAGTAFVYTAFNSDLSCSFGPNMIDAPVCPCPLIADPVPNPVASICPGDPIPTLSVTTDPGLTADWYDDPVAGSQLASATLSYTPATDGTYYVEARDPVNNCTSNRIAITIVTNPMPGFMVAAAVCAPDLLSYEVSLQVSDADVVMVNAGVVTDNGGGSFTVSMIPSGTDLMVTLNNTVTGCSFSDNVPALDCACGTVNPPVSGGDQSICEGDPIPDLSASVGAGQTVDWYDAPSDGTLLASNSLTFSTITAGTYYAETRVLIDDCVSFARTAITLTINPTPTVVSINANCAANLLTYTVDISTTNTTSIQTDFGTVINTGGGTFSITDIPAGSDVTFTAFNADMTCSAGPETVPAPDCSCPFVNPPVSGGDEAICAGAPIPNLTVTVGADETADWYDMAAGGTLLSMGSLSFTPPGPGTYFVEARNSIHNCTSERIAISFVENPLPSFVLQDTVCAPDLLTYQVDIMVSDADEVIPSLGTLVDNGGGSFSITGIPSGNALNFTLNNTQTTCSISASVPAPDCSCDTVDPPVSNGNIAICTGDPIPTISVMVPADQTVDWYDAAFGGTLLMANSTSFSPASAGTYFAEARVTVNNCVSAERTAITIIVNPTPVLVNSDAACAPDLLSYTVNLELTDAASIQVDNGVVNNNGDGTFTISGIPSGQDLIFTAFNTGMSCELGPETITAPDCSCPLVDAPASGPDPAICAGDPIPTLSVTVTNGLTADWYDAPVAGNLLAANTLDYTPPAIGTYYVEARDPVNNCTSERIEITITENVITPPVNLGDQAICDGETIPALTVGVALDETVDWYDSPTDGNLLQAGSPTFTPSGAGIYYAETRSLSNGCTSTERVAVMLTVFENPVLSVSEITEPGCNDNDGSITVSANGGLAPYQYQLDAGTFQDEPIFGSLGVNSYTITVMDANGCSNNILQSLSAPDAVSAVVDVDGIITCAVESVPLEAAGSSTGSSIIYSWVDPNGLPLPSMGLIATAMEAGTYELIVMDTLTACSDAATVVVIADLQAPNVNAGDDGLITCEVETAALQASSSTPGNLDYSWQAFEGGMIDGSVNQSNITALAAGLYQVMVTNPANGCSQTDTVRVLEIINTEINLNITTQDPSCAGDQNGSILLEAADPTSTLLFAPEGEAYSMNNTFFNLGAGSYNFTVQDEFGCEVATTVVLQDGNAITLDLGNDISINLGDSIQFDPIVNVPANALASVKWTNGQWLDCDDCLEATTLGNMFSTNLFQLVVTDSLGCTATDDILVFVNRERHVFVPSAFSPNDDGSNDVLFIQGGADIERIESFTVFNRWGEIVFNNKDFLPNDPQKGWDGTARGQQLLNAAVFVYMIEVRFRDGEVEVFSGDVVLLR